MAPSKWAISAEVSGGIILTISFYQLKKKKKPTFKMSTFSLSQKGWLHLPLPTSYKWIAKRKAMKAAIKINGLIN